MPRKPKAIISTGDLDNSMFNGQAPDELREAGFDASDIQVVSANQLRDKAAEAKFMEEKVEIMIEAGNGPNDPEFVHSGHQGVTQYVRRGVVQPVKRKFLYSLLAANSVKFACAFGKDGSGNEFNRLSGSGQRAHRVSLVSDKNPQGGMKWVQEVVASLSRSGLAA
ncbi:MAG: hypothetical protein WC710_14940 [Gallionella sp.]|jgi:hypothetical protein